MRKIPIFTLIIALCLTFGYFVYQKSSPRVNIAFNYFVEEKKNNHSVTGTIDGAGKKNVTLPLSKEMWQRIKKGNRYFVKVSFHNKKQLSKEEKKSLKGPFWSNETNYGMLVNDIKVVDVQPITTSS